MDDNRIKFPALEIDFSDVGTTGQDHDTYPLENTQPRYDWMRMYLIGLLSNQASESEPSQYRNGSLWFDLNTNIIKIRSEDEWKELSDTISIDDVTLSEFYSQFLALGLAADVTFSGTLSTTTDQIPIPLNVQEAIAGKEGFQAMVHLNGLLQDPELIEISTTAVTLPDSVISGTQYVVVLRNTVNSVNIGSELVEAVHPAITRINKSGTYQQYIINANGTDDLDIERGNTLIEALDDLEDNDILLLGAGIFDIQDTSVVFDGGNFDCSLIGLGRDITIIKQNTTNPIGFEFSGRVVTIKDLSFDITANPSISSFDLFKLSVRVIPDPLTIINSEVTIENVDVNSESIDNSKPHTIVDVGANQTCSFINTNIDMSGGSTVSLFDGSGTIITTNCNYDTSLDDGSVNHVLPESRFLVRQATSDPQDGTPANRPPGEIRELIFYDPGSGTGKLYICVDSVTPTWEIVSSS